MNEVWENLRFFTARLKALAMSESLPLGNEGYCVSTGTGSENWVYFPERVTPEAVNDVVRFFGERDEAFMWPVYDGGTEALESGGLLYAGELVAMALDPAGISLRVKEGVTFERVTPELSGEFAATAWCGFAGEGDAPESYCRFVGGLVDDAENVSLYLAKYDGRNAGVFALTNELESVGVYYFATVPELRRKGIASAMMSEVCRMSGGRRIVLQSTPMGVKFYRSFGFDELFKIPVYSTEEDII